VTQGSQIYHSSHGGENEIRRQKLLDLLLVSCFLLCESIWKPPGFWSPFLVNRIGLFREGSVSSVGTVTRDEEKTSLHQSWFTSHESGALYIVA